MSTKNFVSLDPKIDRVIVYLDGARVYRSGKTELPKGFQQVKISGLTKNLIKDSVRVSGKGKGSLGAINVETIYQEKTAHEELNKLFIEEKKLKKELEALEEKLDFTNNQSERMKILSQNFATEFPQWFASGEAKITTLTEFLDFESKNVTENMKTRQKLEEDIEKLNLTLQTLQAKINEYRNRSAVEQTMDIVIGVDVEQAGPFVFEFSYQTRGVSWEPTYDVDLRKDKALIKGMAQIVNRTLENWKDVELAISTAVFKPIRVVDPSPYYIDIYRPQPPGRALGGAMMKRKMSLPESRPPPSPSMDMAKEEKVDEEYYEPLEEPEAELIESPAGVQSYEIPGKWTIPSDGNIYPVTLTTQELSSTKEFYWSAVDSLGVIAQDKITNNDTLILAGNAKVYSEGEFIGETFINQIAPKEEFKLGAREEFKMKFEKKLLERVQVKAGLTKGKRAVSYKYELKLKNFRKEESITTIKDVIPYSRSEYIKLKDISMEPPSTKDSVGVYTWELTLPADKETKIIYSYTVEWDKDYTITPSLP